MRLFLCAALASLLVNSPAFATDHIWSKSGTAVHGLVGKRVAAKAVPIEISSPDHSNRVEVTFLDNVPVISLYKGKKELELPLFGIPTEEEILWSPDSKSVAVTGSDTGITNWTKIFRVGGEKAELVPLEFVQRDMATTYPICEGQSVELEVCHAEENGDQFNYATIAWADATTAVIMAEIPCSSSQGGMMCQVEGYEIDVRSGRILRRMTARELKRRWQSKLAWNLRIPDPPYLKSKTSNAAVPK